MDSTHALRDDDSAVPSRVLIATVAEYRAALQSL